MFSICLFCRLQAQQKEFVLIDSQTKKEFIKKDSLSAVKFLDSLAENNYYLTKITNVKKNDNSTKIAFNKGKNFNEAQIKISDQIVKDLHLKPDFFTKNLDSLKRKINEDYRNQGFAFNRVKTKFIGFEKDIPKVELSVNLNQQRKIDGFVIKGYDKVPKRFTKNLEKEFGGKTYGDKNILKINQNLQNHPFVLLERLPQTLFTKDSTKVFLFLQKKKSNTFDGMIGFGNDKNNKFNFNGSINFNLKNVFNGFESIALFWQRNPQHGQNFDLQVDVPYLMRSNFGTRLQMNIYRQDSTFANLNLKPSLYFQFSPKQKIGLRGNFEFSSTLQENYAQNGDFSKKGFGIFYEFIEPTEEPLFIYKTKISAEGSLLKANYQKTGKKSNQNQYIIFAERNFNVKGNHYLNIKAESSTLDSNTDFTTNELFRIGGYSSLRGFNEQSIYTNSYAFGGAEYRYLVSNQAFFDVFGQLAKVKNFALNTTSKLYSLGLGFNFFLPIGLMTFQISNGTQFGNTVQFQDTKIHWGIVSRF